LASNGSLVPSRLVTVICTVCALLFLIFDHNKLTPSFVMNGRLKVVKNHLEWVGE
jgi:hypothetical protein